MAVKQTPQRRVLATAASQIGYSRWNDPKRGTKYARETQPVFWPRDKWLLANGISYCDIFVTWVFWKALGKDFVNDGGLPAGASYNTDYRASKGGRVSKPPKPGDVLVFDWNWNTTSTNHVGILEKVLPSGNYQTIEGNTSLGASGSQSNGGRVARRVRKPSQVRHIIRPNWSKAGGKDIAQSKPRWETSKLIRSLSKADVKEIQVLLQDKGYSLGSYGVDGSYGKDTYNAVVAFQRASGLAADGVAGKKTLAALRRKEKPAKPASKPSTPKAPKFPLPSGYYYGDRKGPKQSVSGHVRNSGTNDVVLHKGDYHSKGLRTWQARMLVRGWKGIGKADGLFGPKTETVVKQFQKSKGLKVDGKIGPKTWVAAWEEPVV